MSSISADGSAVTLYLQQSGGNIQYSFDTALWTNISWPLTLVNTNDTILLKVIFNTNIVLTSNSQYIIVNSNLIQFGSLGLNNDGTVPIINVNGVSGYNGFIQNGTSSSSGFNDIILANILVVLESSTTASTGAGMLCQSYFATGANENLIVNCSVESTGASIPQNGGGIVGSNAASNNGLLIIGACGCTAAIGSNAGGIVGSSAGATGGGVDVIDCYSNGVIGTGGGGIIGGQAANNGAISVIASYSLGTIGQNAGGIIGQQSGSGGEATVSNCYSHGSIGTDAGGIIGAQAAVMSVTNCYSIGALGTNAGGIYGANYGFGGAASSAGHCYTAGSGSSGGIFSGSAEDNPASIGTNNYSEANNEGSGWSDIHSLFALTDIFPGGSAWISQELNTPYLFMDFMYTPYTTEILTPDIEFNQTFNQTIQYTTSPVVTSAAVVSDNTFSVLAVNGVPGSNPNISINSSTGAISVTFAIPPTTDISYAIVVLNQNVSYATTTFNVTILAPIVVPTTVSSLQYTMNLNYGEIYDVRIGCRIKNDRQTNPRFRFLSYADYIKYQTALLYRNCNI